MGQGAILESEEMTAEQKRIQKVSQEIRVLEADYSKANSKHKKNVNGLNPNSFSLNADKEYLLQRKKRY